MKSILYSILIAAMFATLVPTKSAFALSSYASYRVRNLEKALNHAKRLYQSGKVRQARLYYTRNIDRMWKTIAKNHASEFRDPRLKQMTAKLASFWKQLFRGVVRKRQATPQERKLQGLKIELERVKQFLMKGYFINARSRYNDGGRTLLIKFLQAKQRYRLSAKNAPGIASLERDIRKAARFIKLRKKWPVAFTSCSKQTCDALYARHNFSCPVPAPRVRSSLKRDVDRFFQKLGRLHSAKQEVSPFFKKHPSCCSASIRSRLQDCKRSQQSFQQQWSRYLAFIGHCRVLSDCTDAIKRNKHPLLQVDIQRIQQKVASRQASAARYHKAQQAKVARTFCPSQKRAFANRRLKRQIRRAVHSVARMFSIQGWKKTPGKYTLTSRKRRTYNRWRKSYTEYVRVRACIKQTKAGRTSCKAYAIEVKRSKPYRGRWGSWKYAGVTNSYYINCNSYR